LTQRASDTRELVFEEHGHAEEVQAFCLFFDEQLDWTAFGIWLTMLLQSRGESTTAPGAVTKPHKGRPPLFLDFGARGDREALDLSRAAMLANHGKPRQAAAIFARAHAGPRRSC